MKKLHSLIFSLVLFLISLNGFAQTDYFIGYYSPDTTSQNYQKNPKSDLILVYKLDAKQAFAIVGTKEKAIEFYKNNKPNYQFKNSDFKTSSLPRGNYLLVSADKNIINLNYINISNYRAITYSAGNKEMALIVLDSNNIMHKNAIIKNTKGKTLSFDNKINAFIIPKKSNLSYYLIVNDQVIIYQVTSNYQSRFDINSFRNVGFIALDKPKYKPGDTIRFKAFVYTNKEKPFNKPLVFVLKNYSYYNNDGKENDSLMLNPSSPGAYEGEFIMGESKEIDYTYYISVSHKKGIKLSNSFKYEDYKLDNYYIDVEADKIILHKGDDLSIQIIAKDFNNEFIRGGRYKIELKSKEFRYINNYSTFIPDILFQKEGFLLSTSPTKIDIKSGIIPDYWGSIEYTITIWNSINEQKVYNSRIGKFQGPRLTLINIADSIQYDLKNADDWTLVAYYPNQIIELKDHKGKIPVDFTKKIPYFSFSHNGETTDQQCNTRPNINFKPIRIGDSIYLKTSNPLNIPIKISLYDKDKLLIKRTLKQIDTSFYWSPEKEISFNYEYYFNGYYYTNNKQALPPLKKSYQMKVEIPETVQPGSNQNLKIQVLDYKGNPVPNANLTAWAYNSEFKDAQNVPEYYLPSSVELKSSNVYRISQNNKDYNHIMEYDDIQKLNIADSILYYNLLFPKNGSYSEYLNESGNLCHFAPYVVNNGKFIPIYYIIIDSKPIYYHWAHNGIWSFPYLKGKHQLLIRTAENLYSIDSVELKPGKKLEISIDAGNLPSFVKSRKMNEKLTKYEAEMIEKFLLYIDDYSYYGNYFVQSGNVQKSKGGYIFPKYSGPFIFLSEDEIFTGRITPSDNIISPQENGIRYETSEIELNRNQKYIPFEKRNHRLQTLKSNVGDYSIQIIPILKTSLKLPPELPFTIPKNGVAKLVLESNIDSISLENIYIISLNQDDYFYNKIKCEKKEQYYSRDIGKFDSGNYKLIAYTKNNNLLIYKLRLQADGTTYFKLDENFDSYIPLNQYKNSHQDSIIASQFYMGRIRLVEEYNYYGVEFINSKSEPDTVKFKISFINDNWQRIDKGDSWITRFYGKFMLYETGSEIRINDSDTDSLFRFNNANYKTTEVQVSNLKPIYDFILIKPEEEKNQFMKNYNEQNANYHSISFSLNGRGTYGNSAGWNDFGSNTRHYAPPVLGIAINRNEPVKHKSVLFMDGRKSGFPRGRGDYSGYNTFRGNTNYKYSYSPSYLFDGVDMDALNQVQTLTGGTPAMYGDMDSTNFLGTYYSQPNIRSNFSDVGFWVPNLITDENGYASATVKFPDNITSWNMVILAAGPKGEKGRYTQTIKAVKDSKAILGLPRFLTQTDSCYIHTQAINYSENPFEIEEYFKTNGNLVEKRINVLDSFLIKEYLVSAKDSIIDIEYGFASKNGNSDAELRKLEIEKIGVDYAIGDFHWLKGDTSFTIKANNKPIKLTLYNGMLDVLLSDIERVKIYKYNCNEQIASKLMILLLQQDVYQKLGIKFHDKSKIKKLIKMLEENKNPNVSWGWWGNSDEVSWISNHVTLALMMAKDRGYNISILNSYQYEYIFRQIKNQPYFRYLYIRNNNNIDPTSLKFNIKNQSTEEVLWDFKTKLLLKMPVKVEDVLKLSKKTNNGGLYWGENAYSRDENQILCTSIAFEIIYTLDSLNPALDQIMQYLMNRHGYDQLNTFEIAYMANAVLPYYLQNQKNFTPAKITDSQGNEVSFNQIIIIPAGETFSIHKEKGSDIYAASWSEYFETNPQTMDSLFKVKTQFLKNNAPISIFRAGDNIQMEVQISAKRKADYVMVEVPIPASANYLAGDVNKSIYEVHREHYKDKLIIYFSELPEGGTSFTINLQLGFSGGFSMNPATVKEMYYPFFFGRNQVKKIIVRQPDK